MLFIKYLYIHIYIYIYILKIFVIYHFCHLKKNSKIIYFLFFQNDFLCIRNNVSFLLTFSFKDVIKLILLDHKIIKIINK